MRSMQGRSMRFPDRDSGAVEMFFQIVDGVSAVMKNRSGERGVGLAFGEDADEMFGLARAAGRDHRNVGGSRNRSGKSAVETGLHAIGIHGSEQNFARRPVFAARGPLDGVDAFVVASSACVDVPTAGP